MQSWTEEEQLAWRVRSASKYIHTYHSLDDPCKMGRSHYGNCFYILPEMDELLKEVHRKRLDQVIYGRR